MSDPQQNQGPGLPRDAEEVRLDLELTREELGQTVQALEDKLKPVEQARDQVAQAATRMNESLPPTVVNGAGTAATAVRRNRTTVLSSAAALVVLALIVKRRRGRK